MKESSATYQASDLAISRKCQMKRLGRNFGSSIRKVFWLNVAPLADTAVLRYLFMFLRQKSVRPITFLLRVVFDRTFLLRVVFDRTFSESNAGFYRNGSR